MTSVGIIPGFTEAEDRFSNLLKDGLLLFDDVMLADFDEAQRRMSMAGQKAAATDVEFLAAKNLIRFPEPEILDRIRSDALRRVEEERAYSLLESPASRNAMTLQRLRRGGEEDFSDPLWWDYVRALDAQHRELAPAHWEKSAHYTARALAAELRRSGDAAFIVSDPTGDLAPSRDRQEAVVLQIIMDGFDFPREETPLEAILSFREDARNRQSLLGLRRWTRGLAASEMREAEVREELEYLLNEHRAALGRHKLRGQTTKVQAFIVLGAEVLECLVKLRLTKLAQLGLHFLEHAGTLLPSEIDGEGRAVSYLVRVKRAFAR